MTSCTLAPHERAGFPRMLLADRASSSSCAALMLLVPPRFATCSYTICPSGDTPESQRIYQAVQRGSVPLVTDRFQLPFGQHADWQTFSAPLCILPDGTIGLPSVVETRLLMRAVHAHASAFDCEPSNPFFLSFIARALRVFAGWLPPSSREPPVSVWSVPRAAPLSAVAATTSEPSAAGALSLRHGKLGGRAAKTPRPSLSLFAAPRGLEPETNENWRACPTRERRTGVPS
jgi:hypothetical protein